MILQNKSVILIQKILLVTCLLNLIIVFPVLGNSKPPKREGSNGITKPAINLSSLAFLKNSGSSQNIGWLAHSIKHGETLSQISRDYFVTLAAIVSLNQIRQPDQIHINQKILIPPVDYAYGLKENFIRRYQIKDGDTVNEICRDYGLNNWQIYRLNPEIENRELVPGRSLFVPGKPKTLFKNPVSISNRALRIGLIRPVRGLISSRFGPRWGRIHYGIDLAAPTGQPVQAAAEGEVSFAGWRGTYGQLIIIKHGGYTTYYGHLSKILVKSGEYVGQGKTIGLVGSTGHAYGSHLHFEVERSGAKVNPLLYLK
jgi:LysM repeat protein